ncbi:MAG: hypothetical protein ACLQBB_12505 [Solirubrobacteraceae bacterium]
MTGLTRLRPLGPATLFALCIALVLPASGQAAATVTYTKESQPAYESQLAKDEIASATFNKRVRSLRITTKNGQYFLYKYPKKGSPQVEQALKAKHVTVTVLTPAEAEKEAKAKPVHHKIRYIAGGILIVIVIVVGVVLLVRRRRVRD